MLKILQHPALVNPTRWLRCPKKHASSLYQLGYYPLLKSNPFAAALTSLESNSPNTTLPNGDGIPLVVCNESITQEKPRYVLTPRIDEEIHEPNRLMVNSSKYVKSMINNTKAVQKLVPLGFIQKNKPTKQSITLQDDMLETIEGIYTQKIQALLANVNKDDSGENGIVLKKMESPLRVEGGITYINNSGGVYNDQELYIDYNKHPRLTSLIILYTDFKNL